MSYDPLRDSFDLMEATREAIITVAERIDEGACDELHKEQCGCGDEANCPDRLGMIYQAPSEFVIAWLMRAGMVSAERVFAEAAL